MSVKKSFKQTLLLGSLVAVIAGAYLVTSDRSAPSAADEAKQIVSKLPETQPAPAAVAELADENEVQSHPDDCAHCLAAVEPSSSPSPRELHEVHTRQASNDVYFKSLFSNGDRIIPETVFDSFKGSTIGQHKSIQLGSITVSGQVAAVQEHPHASSYALELSGGLGRLVVNTDPHGGVSAFIGFNGDSRAISISSYNQPTEEQSEAGLLAIETEVSEVFCAPEGAVFPLSHPFNRSLLGAQAALAANETSGGGGIGGPVGALPVLDSNLESDFVIYCDFDGENVVDDPLWGSIVALPHPRAQEEDWVTAVWQRVSEDFAPFDINITTDRAVFDAADPDKRLHVIITPTDDALPGSGGVAFVGTFRFNSPIVWVFNLSEYSAATTISHEAGHAFGLFHDGTTLLERYFGHNDGYTSGWGPIMGAPFGDGFDDEVDTWSIGEYDNADNQDQDDLAIIGSAFNGFGFKTDDFADTIDSALLEPGALTITEDDQVSGNGLISTEQIGICFVS